MNNQIIFCAVEIANIVIAIYSGDFIVSEIKKQFRKQNFVTTTIHSVFAETKSGLSCQPTISSHSTSMYTFYFFSFFLFYYYDYLIIFFLRLIIHFWALKYVLILSFEICFIWNWFIVKVENFYIIILNTLFLSIKFQFAVT